VNSCFCSLRVVVVLVVVTVVVVGSVVVVEVIVVDAEVDGIVLMLLPVVRCRSMVA
jgi:hypothetical protein